MDFKINTICTRHFTHGKENKYDQQPALAPERKSACVFRNDFMFTAVEEAVLSEVKIKFNISHSLENALLELDAKP